MHINFFYHSFQLKIAICNPSKFIRLQNLSERLSLAKICMKIKPLICFPLSDEHRSATFSHQEENSIPDHNTAKIDGDFPLDKITSKSNSIITNAEALKPEIVSRGEPISPLGIRPHGLKLDAKLDQSRLISVEPVSPQGSDRGRPPPFLRRNQAGGRLLARAKVKTLRTTFIILATFLLCWTPYVVMTSW